MTEQEKRVTLKVSNLAEALNLAIAQRERWEQYHGYTLESALLSGWKATRNAIILGIEITIEN